MPVRASAQRRGSSTPEIGATRLQVTIKDRGIGLQERLRERLANAERLLCAEHGQPVVAVTIHDRDNGWFDCSWITCCERLEQRAAAILKQRC